MHLQWNSSAIIVPAVAVLMYAFSLSHWASSMSLYNTSVEQAVNVVDSGAYVGYGVGLHYAFGVGYSSEALQLFMSACLVINVSVSLACISFNESIEPKSSDHIQ